MSKHSLRPFDLVPVLVVVCATVAASVANSLAQLLPTPMLTFGEQVTATLDHRNPDSGLWYFSGTPNQPIVVAVGSDAFDPVVELLDPNGEEVARDDDGGPGLDSLLFTTLQHAGWYRIRIRAFFEDESGEYSVALHRLATTNLGEHASATGGTRGTLMASGPPVAVWTFASDGDQTTRASVRADGFDASLRLFDISGREITTPDTVGSEILTFLPTRGQYQFVVVADDGGSGTYELTVDLQAPSASPDHGHWYFEGEAGQVISARVDAAFDATLRILAPSGEVIAVRDREEDLAGLGSRVVSVLPSTASYRVIVSGGEGPYDLLVRPVSLTRLQANTGTDGQLGLDTQVGGWTYDGGAAEVVSIAVSSTEFDTVVHVFSEDGQEIARDDDGGRGTDSFLTATLPAEGAYRILVTSWDYPATGDYTLAIYGGDPTRLNLDERSSGFLRVPE